MTNFKILIEYDGFNYSGWQSQINAVSVQGQIEKPYMPSREKKP